MALDAGSRIGIVTGDRVPELSTDGRELRAALQARGHAVDAVRWDDPSLQWGRYECLVVRSCWEYHAASDAFRDWIDAVEESGTVVVNAPDVLRWNMHKSYLVDLERAGVPVVPTEYVEAGSETDLAAILERTGWTDVVVKPAIGTSSAGVWRVQSPITPDDATRFRSQRAETDLLVQRFRPEIADGELSFVFLDGAFSHAYRCNPAADDFRSHPNFGGTVEPADPRAALVDQARDVMATARAVAPTAGTVDSGDETPFVYARVDGVERDGAFELMELELIEPHLGLSKGDGAVDRFADAIETALDRRASLPAVEGE